MSDKLTIARCVSCDGYGWFDGETGAEDCDWCAGVGYVYRDERDRDSKIPPTDYAAVADELEALEAQRLREMGYGGRAKQPWRQQIRDGTRLGRDPYSEDDD